MALVLFLVLFVSILSLMGCGSSDRTGAPPATAPTSVPSSDYVSTEHSGGSTNMGAGDGAGPSNGAPVDPPTTSTIR